MLTLISFEACSNSSSAAAARSEGEADRVPVAGRHRERVPGLLDRRAQVAGRFTRADSLRRSLDFGSFLLLKLGLQGCKLVVREAQPVAQLDRFGEHLDRVRASDLGHD